MIKLTSSLLVKILGWFFLNLLLVVAALATWFYPISIRRYVARAKTVFEPHQSLSGQTLD